MNKLIIPAISIKSIVVYQTILDECFGAEVPSCWEIEADLEC